jgi:hypothetical protein
MNYKSYSQASQDCFILTLTQGKRNGTFVEIGSNDPIGINNTYVLEKDFGWNGIMVEYDAKYLESYKTHRPNSFHIIADATTIDYRKAFADANLPNNIDFLQIDLEVENKSTLNTLIKLDTEVMNTHKFATVTFEHDIYRGDCFNTRQASRDIFQRRGYVRLFSDVKNMNNAFEDWYVHPELVDSALLARITPHEGLEHTQIASILKSL